MRSTGYRFMLSWHRLQKWLPIFALAFFTFTGQIKTAHTAEPQTIIVMGDSISAAYGINPSAGWVHLLADKVATEYKAYSVVNASVSGETTGGGLARLPAILARHQPEVVIIELGGNDGLRGYPIAAIKSNLKKMLGLCKEAGARTLLIPMRVPPNYGPTYTEAFFDIFTTVSAQLGASISIFFLEGVAGDPDLMQPDGIHPSVQAQPILLTNIWPALRNLLDP